MHGGNFTAATETGRKKATALDHSSKTEGNKMQIFVMLQPRGDLTMRCNNSAVKATFSMNYCLQDPVRAQASVQQRGRSDGRQEAEGGSAVAITNDSSYRNR